METLFAQAQVKDIAVPQGYKRVSYSDTSFSGWVQSLKFKSDKNIQTYDGDYIADGEFNPIAVVDMPLLFKSNLEQCADYCMRFWAEYHKSRNALNRLYLFDYSGNKRFFSKSGKSFTAFLKTAFMNTNSFSLKKGCASIDQSSLKPGDMFVQNSDGGIGHVSMIVDVCTSGSGTGQLYMIGFSFMPAQEFHIEKATDGYGVGGWFTYDGAMRYLKEIFVTTPVLRRF
ncbi:MAG: DUF4846 domain-containing protein [Chlorobiales bacterium]|nr:DUF4846 domain-containing protein [Chlorobiales bacterium]